MTRGAPLKYSQAQLDFIRSNCALGRKELTALVNAKFSSQYTVDQIKNLCSRNKWTTGRYGLFEKGHKTWNKGKTGYMGSNVTSFRKGNTPHNTRPLFSERLSKKDGFIFIKVRESHPQFVPKHRWLWEKANCPIPEGHNVVFINQDKTDFRIENLMLASNAELGSRNKRYSKIANAETNETCLLLAKLNIAARKRIGANQ